VVVVAGGAPGVVGDAGGAVAGVAPGTVVVAGAVVVVVGGNAGSARTFGSSSGGSVPTAPAAAGGATRIVRSAWRPMRAKAGAATSLAYADVVGSSTTMMIDTWGSSAGMNPAKLAT
jgi:hypothetical protein